MIIAEMKDSDRSAWDAYVENSEHSLPHHLSGWRDIMAETYGYQTHYLLAREGEQVVGVLPLLIVRSLLVGSRALSLPGGLCAERTDVAQALIAAGEELAQQAHVEQLILQDTRQIWPGEWQTSTDHLSWIADVSPGPEAVLGRLGRYTRRDVRRAQRNGLVVEIDRQGKQIDRCHDVLSRFAHGAGTPFFGRSFLARVVETFPDRIVLVMVYAQQKPIGAYFLLSLRDILWGIWGGSLRDHLDTGAAYLAYWELLSYAAGHGYRLLDLGRSPAGSGASEFKSKWSSFSQPIHQQVASLKGHQPAESMIGRIQSDARLKRFTQIWPRLPRPLVHYLGPRLRRHVPFA
jgi:FemAB-related protein (PEP-CTERM system-associated)